MFTEIPIGKQRQLEIDRVAIKIRMHAPGYFVLSSLAELAFTEQVPTACTNGARIWFGEQFWLSLTEQERAFVWLHEILHIALRHHLKRGDRSHELFNVACDYVINDTLARMTAKHSWLAAPENILLDQQKYAGLNEFDVYKLLEQQEQTEQQPEQPELPESSSGDQEGSEQGSGDQEGSEQGSGDTSGLAAAVSGKLGLGGVIDGPQLTKAQQVSEDTRIVETVQRAAAMERLAGNLSGTALEDIANQQAKPLRSLQSFLSQFCERAFVSGANWSRPNKRLAAAGIHYASPLKDNLEPLVLAIDTSGSIGRDVLERIAGIVVGIFNGSEFSKLYVAYFNSSVYQIDEFTNGQRFKLAQVRSGGTSFEPVFELTSKVKARALVMLTDGCAEYPSKPKFPVAWVLAGDYVSDDMSYGRKFRVE